MEQQPICPQCGTPILPNSAFCAQCGAAVAAAQQPETASQPNPPVSNAQWTQTQQSYSQTPPQQPYQQPYQQAPYQQPIMPKSKLAAGLLAIFLGSIGIHNFYLGYTNRALIQLLVTVCTCGLGGVAMGIWALVEGIQILTGSIVTDARGIPLAE